MADSGAAAAPKPSSSVKLVLLGEAAVGKVCAKGSPRPAAEEVDNEADMIGVVIARAPVREQ